MTRHQARELYAGCSLILALAKLPEAQRDAVIGHLWRGETYEALAARRGVTRQAVKHNETDGLKNLRRLLATRRDEILAA